ncbi:hypothetical protein ACIRVF_25025 [Kitasatospora sp. NPDC101157]|uniref:hypothetical protein n=1 Tax=Kitasatospora sp. NPDC101157 TaxID=3364098 RepID=UPI003801BD3C
MRRTSFAWAAAVAAVATVAGAAAPATAEQVGTPGTGEVLPYPGPEGLLWIPDWTGDGGAVTGGAFPAGPPVTVTLGCRAGGGPGEARVSFTAVYGDTTPVDFTVACPAEAVGTGSAVVTAEQGRSFHVAVATSAPDVHWGLTVTQPDA